jgi:hypothetical protein
MDSRTALRGGVEAALSKLTYLLFCPFKIGTSISIPENKAG